MAEPAWVKSSAGAVDTAGTFQDNLALVTAGNLIIFQVNADGDTDNNAVTLDNTSSTIEALDGTANTMTVITASSPIGATTASSHWLWVGRVVSTPVQINATTAGEDVYFQTHEFSGANAGTALADVIENATAGSFVNATGNSASMLDTAVQTLGADRLALNFGARNDDQVAAYTSFTGETGGDWVIRAQFQTATGTDAGILLQTASMPSAGTINGGSMSMDTDPWGVIGFALIPAGAATHFGAFAVPLTLTIATAGTRTRFGSFAVPLTLTIFTAGTVGAPTIFGSFTVPLTLSIATSGTRTRFGSASVPLTLSIATAGSHTAIGRTIGLGLTFNSAVNGTRTTFSTFALPLTLNIGTSGARASFGSFSLPLTVSVATNGTHTGIGSSSLALSLDIATRGFVGAFSTLDVPLVLSIGTRGFIEGAIEEEPSRRLRVDKEKLEKEPWPPVPATTATRFSPYKPGYMTKKEP